MYPETNYEMVFQRASRLVEDPSSFLIDCSENFVKLRGLDPSDSLVIGGLDNYVNQVLASIESPGAI